MIDNRKALSVGYEVRVGEDRKLQVTNEIWRGTSCIVYDGALYDDNAIRHKVRVKELYPVNLPLRRDENNNLVCTGEFINKLVLAKQRFKETYFQALEFRKTYGLFSSNINSNNILEFNNTCYIITILDFGIEYGEYCDKSLMEVLEHIKSVATVIKKYHTAGFLYLDLKPENIFVLPEIPEYIYLSDFDSIVRIEQLRERKIVELSYSDGFSAPEQVQGQIHMIGKHTDIYALGAILFFKIFGRRPKTEDCRISNIYFFTSMDYYSESYCPELLHRLSHFFHKTLSTSIHNRWTDMNILIDELDELIKLAALSFLS